MIASIDMQNIDEWMAFIATHLSDPVSEEHSPDGTISFTGGDPPEVVVSLTRSTIVVFEYAIREDAAHAPTPAPRPIGSVRWRRARNPEMIRAVTALIAAARDSRLAKFGICARCERSTPPERMHDDEVCSSCAAIERRAR